MRIVAGGQTGVDRAALDFAIDHGLEHGGWCPAGRLAEDGRIPDRYRLIETESADPHERTERNVRDSDATVIIARRGELAGGTLFTSECCAKHRKPLLTLLESDGLEHAAGALRRFLAEHEIRVLNVAGPRESEAPGIGRFVRQLLAAAVRE